MKNDSVQLLPSVEKRMQDSTALGWADERCQFKIKTPRAAEGARAHATQSCSREAGTSQVRSRRSEQSACDSHTQDPAKTSERTGFFCFGRHQICPAQSWVRTQPWQGSSTSCPAPPGCRDLDHQKGCSMDPGYACSRMKRE